MRGTPTRGPYWPHDNRPIDLPPSRNSFVSWSESKESAIAHQRANIGFVFQRFNRFPHKTALENVIEAPIQVRHASGARSDRGTEGAREAAASHQ